MRHKTYICEFRNTVFRMPANRTFLKFGVTRHANVMDRFNPDVGDAYEKDYSDWQITPKFSMWHPTLDDALHWEKYWLNHVFPNPGSNKVWVEKTLGCPTENYYDKASGITELRLVTNKQVGWVMYKAYQMKERLLA